MNHEPEFNADFESFLFSMKLVEADIKRVHLELDFLRKAFVILQRRLFTLSLANVFVFQDVCVFMEHCPNI
ncbi:CLUMA_CG010136, isoform A [Clunio marinus]|uniref:CLUMA_CG010136, isoform A n=1 Tax=Clunio marinus TaxID=568069 RepID=A0A1J1IDZ1_9DIPT|nr:CLUMA_CG010136, isoform A [Clunio marinus]